MSRAGLSVMIRVEGRREAIGSGPVRLPEDSSASPYHVDAPRRLGFAGVLLSLGLGGAAAGADEADLILHHGKVVTVDRDFSVRQALAVKGDRLLRVGTDEEVLETRGPRTAVVDLGGKTVLPGLIDSHTHPTGASMTEFDHPIPEMETVAGRAGLHPVAGRSARRRASGSSSARCSSPGSRSSATRPATSWTGAAPENPVLFSTGPDASLNSLALKLSGIDKDFKARGAGQGREGPADRRADRHPPQPHPVREGRRRRAQAHRAGPGPAPARAVPRLQLGRHHRRHRPRRRRRRRSTATSRLHEAGALTVRLGDLAARRQPGPARRDPRGASARWPSTRSARAGRCCGSSASRPSSTAACSPAAPTCASPGA